jgi:hypothetical protein
MKTILLLLVILLVSSSSLNKSSVYIVDDNDTLYDSLLYQNAVADAIYPMNKKINSSLVAITDANPDLIWDSINNEKYLLVVTWKQDVKFYRDKLGDIYNTGKFPIWVTTSPELKSKFHTQTVQDTNKRLLQMLGLPPNASYNYFVEFWVKPSDLFRPCPDSEISDCQCNTYFPKGTDSLHIKWINENRISRYYDKVLYNQYPWTQLGYTYDWSPENPTHFGLSEFVIGENKKIIVKAIYTTSEYLKIK